jgi:hypothetical protein
VPDPAHAAASAVLSSTTSYKATLLHGVGHGIDGKKESNARVAAWQAETGASQLTHHGLCELFSTMLDKEIGCLYRGNQIYTVLKYLGELHLLATDAAVQENVMWQRLDSSTIDGEVAKLHDCNFHRVAIVRTVPLEAPAAPTTPAGPPAPTKIRKAASIANGHAVRGTLAQPAASPAAPESAPTSPAPPPMTHEEALAIINAAKAAQDTVTRL